MRSFAKWCCWLGMLPALAAAQGAVVVPTPTPSTTAPAPVPDAQSAATDVTAVTPATPARDFDRVVVRGVQTGPKLWKVSRGDHVLWILGTLSPLPRGITWDSRRADVLIAESQEVVTHPTLQMRSTGGLFANLLAIPFLIGVRDNPDGKQLADVIPAELYRRWEPLKRKYMGGGHKVEKWRPLFAALALYEAAIKDHGLSTRPVVDRAVEKAARKAKVKITVPAVLVTVDKPRAAIKEFKAADLIDVDCLRKTIDRIDTDLDTMIERGNAWSVGDVAALRRLPQGDQMAVCIAALTRLQLQHVRGVRDFDVAARKAWMDAASGALERNQVSFALAPIRLLLQSDGYVAGFRAMGDRVEAPDAGDPPPDTAAAEHGPSGG